MLEPQRPRPGETFVVIDSMPRAVALGAVVGVGFLVGVVVLARRALALVQPMRTGR